jgi:hypothetical protein
LPIFEDFKPDLVLVSCGFDSGRGDPLGGMELTQDGYAYMTRRLMGLAKGKVIVVLEGGYNFETLAVSSEAVLRTLLGEELPLKNSISNLKTEETLANLLPKHRTMTHAENFLTTHAKYRPFLKTKPVLLKLEQEVLRRIIKGSKRDDKFITSGKPEKFIFDQKTVMKKLTLTEKDFYQRAKTCDFAQIIPEFSGSVFVSGKGEYIRLENLFFQMENASIVEVKLGFDPNSNKKGDPKSQIKNKQKALATSSQRLGFRIQGFIFKDEQGEIASRQCKGSLYLDRQEEDFIEIFDGLLMSNERKNENMEAAEYFLGFVRKVKEICEKEIFDVSGVSLVFLVDNTRKTQGFCSKMIGFGNCMQSKEIKEKTKAALGNLEEYFCKLLKYVQDLNLN